MYIYYLVVIGKYNLFGDYVNEYATCGKKQLVDFLDYTALIEQKTAVYRTYP